MAKELYEMNNLVNIVLFERYYNNFVKSFFMSKILIFVIKLLHLFSFSIPCKIYYIHNVVMYSSKNVKSYMNIQLQFYFVKAENLIGLTLELLILLQD